jgi:hypothetical protein
MVNTPLEPLPRAGRTSDAPSAAVDVRLVWAAGGHNPGGTWWPRTRDAPAELVLLLPDVGDHLGGAVDRVSLNIDAWDSNQPHRLRVGDRLVRLGWFRKLDPGTVTLTRGSDPRVTLRIIPPDLDPGAARELLVEAAQGEQVRG